MCKNLTNEGLGLGLNLGLGPDGRCTGSSLRLRNLKPTVAFRAAQNLLHFVSIWIMGWIVFGLDCVLDYGLP